MAVKPKTIKQPGKISPGLDKIDAFAVRKKNLNPVYKMEAKLVELKTKYEALVAKQVESIAECKRQLDAQEQKRFQYEDEYTLRKTRLKEEYELAVKHLEEAQQQKMERLTSVIGDRMDNFVKSQKKMTALKEWYETRCAKLTANVASKTATE